MTTLFRAATFALLALAAVSARAEKNGDKTVKLPQSGDAKLGMMAPSFGLWGLKGDGPFVLERIRKTPTPAPLLITFGASWCTPCAAGLPRLKKLADKHPELRLVLVDVDRDSAAAKKWVEELGLTSTLVLWDKFEVAAKLYGAASGNKVSIPKTFLVDEKGRLRAIYSIEGSDLEAVIEADLKAALEAPGIAGQPPPGGAVPASVQK